MIYNLYIYDFKGKINLSIRLSFSQIIFSEKEILFINCFNSSLDGLVNKISLQLFFKSFNSLFILKAFKDYYVL